MDRETLSQTVEILKILFGNNAIVDLIDENLTSLETFSRCY